MLFTNFCLKKYFKVSKLENKSSNPIVNKIDGQLKEITRKLKRETDEIESLSAPYHKFELKNQNCNFSNIF